MNSTIVEAILTVGSSWALSTLVKATLLTALGLSAAQLAGRKRAAFRHALLAGTFGVLLALPVVSAVAPPIGIALRGPQARSLAPAARRGAAMLALPVPPGAIPVGSEPWSWSVARLLAAAWIAGMVISLLPAGAGLRQVFRLRRSGFAWQHGQSVADGLSPAGGIRRRVAVLLHEDLAGPMTCGVRRPAVVLPTDAPN